jgi:hypothetical protein
LKVRVLLSIGSRIFLAAIRRVMTRDARCGAASAGLSASAQLEMHGEELLIHHFGPVSGCSSGEFPSSPRSARHATVGGVRAAGREARGRADAQKLAPRSVVEPRRGSGPHNYTPTVRRLGVGAMAKPFADIFLRGIAE